MQAAQDALARAIAEFDGPQQSRSIVAFDEVISRLEALGTALAVGPGQGDARPGLRVSWPRLLRHRALREGLRELPPAGAAEARLRARQGPRVAEGDRAVQQRQARAGGLPRGRLAPGRSARDADQRGHSHRPGAHRLLPARGPRRRLHGRDRQVRLPDRDADRQHRRPRPGDGERGAGARARQRLRGHRARRRRGLARRRAARYQRRQPLAGVHGGRACARPRSREGLGPHRARQPLAGQPHARAAPPLLRDGEADHRHLAAAGLRARARASGGLARLAAAHVRPARRQDLPQRRGARRDAGADRRPVLRQACASR